MSESHEGQRSTDESDPYDYEQLLRDIRALSTDLGRAPTTAEANSDDRSPSLATIYRAVEDDWATALRDAGVEPSKLQRRSVPRDREAEILADIRKTNVETEGEYLTTRQYDEFGAFATSSVKERFGSWTAACESAGIEPGSKHGVSCEGPQDNRLDSSHERLVAVFLDDCGIEYVVHPSIEGTGFSADFYLPRVDLWVEVDGYVAGERPNRDSFEEKLDHFRQHEMDYVVVESGDELQQELEGRGVEPSD